MATVISAVGDGLDLIRQLIAERGQRRDFDDALADSQVDHDDWFPLCLEFEPDHPCPD